MKIVPNKSILNIISQSSNENEKVLFMYLKPVNDIASNNSLFWYENKGSSGEAIYIWKGESLKQWVVTGNDQIIFELFDKITKSEDITVDKKVLKFSFPEASIMETEVNPFEDITKNIVHIIADQNSIPITFRQKENLNILSGYQKTTTEAKVLFPYGFFNKDFIYNNIEKGIIAVKEIRTAELRFHAVRENIKAGPKKIIGFLQTKFDKAENYTASLSSKVGVLLNSAEINKSNGIFILNSEIPTQSGEIKIKVGEENIIETPFHFIMNADFNISIVNETFKDAYNNTHNKNASDKKKEFEPFTWHIDLLVGTETNFIKLSDLIRKVLLYLGPDIVIADPYFLGDYTIESGQIIIKKFQMPLLNAICHAFFDTAVAHLTVLGYNGRANDHTDNLIEIGGTKTEQRFILYEKVLSKMLNKNILNVDFYSSTGEFHNRYWFGCKKVNDKLIFEKVIIVSNSFGDLKEIDFLEITDKAQKEIIFSKYSSILNSSNKSLSLNGKISNRNI